MFTAILFACFGQYIGCATLTDNRGPYGTLQECRARLEVMIEDVSNIEGEVTIQEAKCIISPKGKRSV